MLNFVDHTGVSAVLHNYIKKHSQLEATVTEVLEYCKIIIIISAHF